MNKTQKEFKEWTKKDFIIGYTILGVLIILFGLLMFYVKVNLN